jgi:signal transduction histidine kinase
VAQVFLLALFAILVALAAFVWRARPHSSINQWFTAFTAFVALWVLGVAGLQGGTNLNAWGRFTFASATLIPFAFLEFTNVYPTQSNWPRQNIRVALRFIGLAIALVSLTTPLIVRDNIITAHGLQRQSGSLYPLFFVYFLSVWVTAVILFFRKWKAARSLARAQLQHLGAAIVVSAAGATAINLFLPVLTGRSTYSWIGPYFALVLVAMIGHAIIRHRLMDLRLAVHRGLAHALIVAVLSGTAILIVRSLRPEWKHAIELPPSLVVFGIVLMTIASSPAQRFINRWLDPYLYRGRIEHSAALREATHRLSHLMQPSELARELRAILHDAFVPEAFSMAARPLDGGPLEELFSDAEGLTPLLSLTPVIIDQPRPAVVIVGPDIDAGPRRAAYDALRSADIEVVVILARRGTLLGVVFLGARRSGDAYYQQDLAFIESLADLASIALENSLLYRQSIQMLEYSDRLLESLQSAVVAVDVFGRITSFNPAARDLFGLDHTALGEGLSRLPSEIGWALAMAVAGIWQPREIESSIDKPNGQGAIPVVLSTALLHDDQSKITGALVVATDLSTVKALERNQRRIEHLAMMARFYAGIAHEIRSPLAAISNFVSMLPDRFDDPEYRETAVRLLPGEVGRIVRLADRLRLMAPSEDGQLSIVALPPLLADIVSIHAPAAEESRIRVNLQSEEDLPKIAGDPSQLIQLFVNLLKNGVESMPKGGLLLIRSYLKDNGQTVVVDFIDEGTGIDPAIRGNIFQPFFTTKTFGTGLGLSICREIADFHRARLMLIPRLPTSGTIARVEFSVADRAEEVGEPVVLQSRPRST